MKWWPIFYGIGQVCVLAGILWALYLVTAILHALSRSMV